MKTGSIYSYEIKNVRLYVIHHRRFPDVFSAIQKHQRNCLQHQLGLKLRCYGQFANAAMNESTKHPKLLPRYEHFTNLLISVVHQRLIHTRVAHMLSQIRENIGFHKAGYK